MAKGFLVSYAGYPYTPSSLTPDNGLANLAGALIRDGHEVRVIDYGTTDLMRRLMPQEHGERLRTIYRGLTGQRHSVLGSLRKIYYLMALRRRDRVLSALHRLEVDRIVGELSCLLESEKANFVGFKLWNGDGIEGAIRMAERLRRDHPYLQLLAGGPHVDLFQERILDITDAFDCLVYAEGEHVICDVVARAVEGRDFDGIPNVIFRKNGHVVKTPAVWIEDLNSLPLPVYEPNVYPGVRDKKIRIAVIDESRGCPYGCNFCIQPIKSGSKIRAKSPDRVLQEIQALVNVHDIRTFKYAGSTTPAKLMLAVARLICEQQLRVRYSAFAEANMVHPEDLAYLRDSGLESLFYGLESGNQGLLDNVFDKKLKKERIAEALVATKKAGIFTVASVIFPAPGETAETRRETLEFLLDVRPDSVPVQFPGVFPGTAWFLDHDRFNISLDKEAYMDAALRYKIKLLYPPRFWSKLPYTVDGKSFRIVTRETEAFVRDLEHNEILVGVPDDMFLLSRLTGIEPKELRDKCREWFYCGDVEAIDELVELANRGQANG